MLYKDIGHGTGNYANTEIGGVIKFLYNFGKFGTSFIIPEVLGRIIGYI